EAGVTTVRNVGSSDRIDSGLRNAIDADLIEGPRILAAGYAITASGGHGDGDPTPPDRLATPRDPLTGVCNGPDECRKAVRLQMKYGADVIKFHASGGVLSLTDPVGRAAVHAGGDGGDRRRGPPVGTQGRDPLPRRSRREDGDQGGRRLHRARDLPPAR